MPLKLEIIPELEDNYTFVLYRPDTRDALVIDPAEFEKTQNVLLKNHLNLKWILNTHHHHDHTGGNAELKAHWKAQLVAPADDRIEGIDVVMSEDRPLEFLGRPFRFMHTPGHTRSHHVIYEVTPKRLFAGDTLFRFGSGRTFEGTAEELLHSLDKLRDFPADSQVYCGHEYTKRNLDFCLELDPANPLLKKSYEECLKKLARNEPTIPFTFQEEIERSPFLMEQPNHWARVLKMSLESSRVALFTELRNRRNDF